MGGRGGYFSKLDNEMLNEDNNEFEKYFNEEQSNSTDDEDTKKEYDGRTKILKNKNIHIKQSTDTIPEEIFIPNLDKITELTRKYLGTTKVIKENNQEFAIRSDKLPHNVEAWFVSNINNLNDIRIVLNRKIKLSTREKEEEKVQSAINNNEWTKSDKDELVNHAITHEYGHFVHRILIEKDRNTPTGKKLYNQYLDRLTSTNNKNERIAIRNKYRNDCTKKIMHSIMNIHYKMTKRMFSRDKDTSYYGRKNYYETFAETFAELNTTKKCGTFAKAMGIYLNKKLKK